MSETQTIESAAPLGLGFDLPEDELWVLRLSKGWCLGTSAKGDQLFRVWLTEADAWAAREYRLRRKGDSKIKTAIPRKTTYEALRTFPQSVRAPIGIVVLDREWNEITRMYWA